MKENVKNILVSSVCLSFIVVVIYAIKSDRLFEFCVISLILFVILVGLAGHKKKRIKNLVNRNIVLSIVFMWSIILCTFFFGGTVIDGLTPVDTLTERIHERSMYKYSGSICNDGWISHSQGQGACSWHDGVSYEFNKGDYSKSFEQCRAEAENLSWLH